MFWKQEPCARLLIVVVRSLARVARSQRRGAAVAQQRLVEPGAHAERRERCEAAWQRRRLVVLCANRIGPKAAEESEAAPKGKAKQKRHKAAELTGLRALVRGVMAQQLWRTVVGYL